MAGGVGSHQVNHPGDRILLGKDFILQPEWSADQADSLEGFLQDVVKAMPTLRVGSYVGTGRVQTIEVTELPKPPSIILIQADLSSTVFVTMQSYPTGEITEWTQKGFTLAAAATRNTALTTYRFLILA